jgi:ABC-type Na+ efflux pump permease subunit
MTSSDVLEELWERKRWTLVLLVIAIAAGIFVAGRGYTVQQASTDILLDTPRSQAVDVGTGGQQNTVPEIDTLTTRARLLGNLMASGPIEAAIARHAGVSPDRLVVVPPRDADAVDPSPIVQGSEDSDAADAVALTVTTDSSLPILHVVTQAPDAATADALATGAVKELKDYLESIASSDAIPDAQRVSAHEIGFHSPVPQSRGPGPAVGVLVALLTLIVGSTVIVLVSRSILGREQPGASAQHPPGNGFIRAPESSRSRSPSERETELAGPAGE